MTDEYEKSTNKYLDELNINETMNFVTDLYDSGMITIADAEMVRKWLNSPDSNASKIRDFVKYLYISNESMFQLFDTTFSLPSLNHKIDVDIERDDMVSNIQSLKHSLKKVRHKTLTRDLLIQLASQGTVCGLWVGTKKNPTLYVFDELEYIFPAYRRNGQWVVWFDLSYLTTLNDVQRESMLTTLSPSVTKTDYDNYKTNNGNYRYIELPQKKSIVLRTHTLTRNQRFGLPWGTQSFLDILHKEKLKTLEKSIANKVINSIAVLTLGDGSKDSAYHDAKIKNLKGKVVRGVKKGLKNNEEGKTPVVAIPHWASLAFEKINTDGLDPKKFDSASSDINLGTNGVDGIFSGKTNFSSGKMTLDILYKKTAVLLEQIEEEVYQKLVNWLLSKKYEDEYHLIYDKTSPLTTKEKVDILQKLNATFGLSLKAVIDCLDGVDYDNYLEDSFYEQEVLKIPERVEPYANAYTSSGDESGAPEKDEVSEAGDVTKTQGSNER